MKVFRPASPSTARRHAKPGERIPGGVAGLLRLQRAIGNRAAARLLRYPAASPARQAVQGSSPYPAIATDPNYEPPAPGVEITAIDDRRAFSWAEAAVRIGVVHMTDVKSMVDNVLEEAGSQPISRLNIIDKGSSVATGIGDDHVSPHTLPRFAGELSRLQGRFNAHGFVHLHGNNVGKAPALVLGLAKLLGVPVYACTDEYDSIFRYTSGTYVCGWPTGEFDSDAPRPGPYAHLSRPRKTS